MDAASGFTTFKPASGQVTDASRHAEETNSNQESHYVAKTSAHTPRPHDRLHRLNIEGLDCPRVEGVGINPTGSTATKRHSRRTTSPARPDHLHNEEASNSVWAAADSSVAPELQTAVYDMASTKKYAGLPDLDDAGTELYQTPGLTDDASTVQTSTLRTESPTPSEDANDNFDRTRFNRDEARRRFEPAVVDAKNVNFSYAVGGNQKSYTTRHRRRRRARRSNGVEEYGDVSDEDDVEVEETLHQRIARLKREAEEVRLEIEQRENEDGEFQDSYESQQGGTDHEDNDLDVSKDVNDLSRLLDSLQTSTRPKHVTLEQELSRRLEAESITQKQASRPNGSRLADGPSTSAVSAIAEFSDRLSTIESALGLSNISPSSNSAAILPTLETLTSHVSLLHSTISPKSAPSSTNNQLINLTSQMPHLDILQSRLHALHQSASNLLASRKAAQTALQDLETVRLRGIRSADHLARYQNLASRRANRPAASTSPSYAADDSEGDEDGAGPNNGTTNRPMSRGAPTTLRRGTAVDDARERIDIADEILTPLFLEDQAEKIKALYNVLPTIQNLQPLLPVVLERLRGLSVVHAGAASARRDMDDLEARLKGWEVEMGRWRDAVVGVESGIKDVEGSMKENLEVVGGMVRGVEERVGRLAGLK